METIEQATKTFEKLAVTIVDNIPAGVKTIANRIATLIKEKQKQGEMVVLGLPTGSSPVAVYKELVKMHREEGLSFSNVITFNLDEYYPMQPDSPHSYVYFMHEHLFRHIDILPANIHIPDGSLQMHEIDRFCQEYEQKIEKAGGIDLQLLGIGRSGHIGFNEPGSDFNSITRLVKLSPITITDAAGDFLKEENVPVKGISAGIRTIMNARAVIMMAWGEKKAKIVKGMIEGKVTEDLPASVLQLHPNVEVFIDEWAAIELTRIKAPWLVDVCTWDSRLQRKAVIWLSEQTQKPILKLTNDDYKYYGLKDLLAETGTSAYDLNLKVYTSIQKTITGWPGGKPESNSSDRPERANPYPKRSLIFSPHPDDDVISMGGTLLRLVDQKHDVHVAYQTSGNIAVFDDDAHRFTDFITDFAKSRNISPQVFENIHKQVVDFLKEKPAGDNDSSLIKQIKGLIRKGEAKAACRFCGVKESNVHFLDLPFYETGKTKKNPLGKEDVRIVAELLERVKPHQIFAAGDLRDPHGTHRVCLDAIFAALEQVKDQEWMKDCYVWLYRGAWQEWDIDEIDMAVPISPDELMRKRKAIFKHQSQKDSPVFPGEDKREFWQRAEDRNRRTAQLYDKLGLSEYEAIEAFIRYKF